jgi:hypothetical protein
MANFDKYFDVLLRHEGGFVDNQYDRGGATNMGVTLETWIRVGYDKDGDGDIDIQDLKKITKDDVKKLAKKLYWDKVGGDKINSQSIAEFLFDWGYNSGPAKAVKKVQQLLPPSIKSDGVIGPATIQAINAIDSAKLFTTLKKSREDFYYAIVRTDSSQQVFLKGWLARNNSFQFKD